MSDISALSHEYETSAKLAEELNEAILAIKRSRLHQRVGLGLDQRRSLAGTVGSLRQQLEVGQGSAQSEFLPQEMVERLCERHRPRMAYFLDDLSRTVSVLENDLVPLDDAIIRVLDEICDAADETASSVFRRMRRR
jgi:hypothetical protein